MTETTNISIPRRPAILVLGGAFNPAHSNHILSLEAARKVVQLPPHNYHVLGGYLAASSDGYVNAKVAKSNTPAWTIADRLAILKLAIEDGPEWLRHSPTWPELNRAFSSAWDMGQRVKRLMKERPLAGLEHMVEEVEILIIMGADRMQSKSGVPKWRKKQQSEQPVRVCIGRDGLMEDIRRKWVEDTERGWVPNGFRAIFVEVGVGEASSTAVRTEIVRWRDANTDEEKAGIVKSLVDCGWMTERSLMYALNTLGPGPGPGGNPP
ncbi:hypothetical protein HK104_003278 [Borealophlyctis nickersoniae]|nr:hypothetical protein HK104_003278 [Borealophlyctis nickersoniae]